MNDSTRLEKYDRDKKSGAFISRTKSSASDKLKIIKLQDRVQKLETRLLKLENLISENK